MSYELAIKRNTNRVRDVSDWYPTPLSVCAAALDLLPQGTSFLRILDPGAGTGPWGLVASQQFSYAHITGIEVRSDVPAHPVYDRWESASFIPLPNPKQPSEPFKNDKARQKTWEQYRFDVLASKQPVWKPNDQQFDLIVGNPPFKYAEAFIRLSLSLLADNGWLVFLLRLAFLEGQERGRGLWREYPPHTVGVCSARPSFTMDGKTDATAYSAIAWQKGFHGDTRLTWILNEEPFVPQLSLWNTETV